VCYDARVRRGEGRIEAWTLDPTGSPAPRVASARRLIPAPGQAVLALSPGTGQPLRRALFPLQIHADGFIADGGADPAWAVGSRLDLLGPIGNGFRPPPGARRWLLAAPGGRADRLLPLLDQAVERGAAVALHARPPLPRLPPQVEFVREVREALPWCDYLALELTAADLEGWLRGEVGWADRLPGNTQALVDLPMPCGLGACDACAVPARRGWRRACRDGPVFEWSDLR
jgi:dihydroorotate dehydrogenase electron transfer subunit